MGHHVWRGETFTWDGWDRTTVGPGVETGLGQGVRIDLHEEIRLTEYGAHIRHDGRTGGTGQLAARPAAVFSQGLVGCL